MQLTVRVLGVEVLHLSTEREPEAEADEWEPDGSGVTSATIIDAGEQPDDYEPPPRLGYC